MAGFSENPMNSQLRVNDALLIADRAFQPFKCIAWTPQDGTGVLTLSVLDGTCTRVYGRDNIAANDYSNPAQLADLLQQARQELSREGFRLAPWSMPA
jgi:hypothetical protein